MEAKPMLIKSQYNKIPVQLSEKEFNQFVLPYLEKGSRGPEKKISYFKIFNYILKLMHTGCQWYNLPIALNSDGKPEIHYSNIFRAFKWWLTHGCFDKIFEASVVKLFHENMLDLSIIHGDGTTTIAKKGAII
jgi:hypothetical protein